ncbi:PatU [Trichothermofontia sp.]
MQDRFQALLKRRLKQEILRHPPLFPWETQVMDYESDVEVGLDSPRERRLAHAWIAQLRDLPLPIPMGEPVLAQLLEQCQTVAQSSLQTGAKLVRAVEDLFPGQFLTLNQLTELVLMSPARGPQAVLGQPLPASYEQADPHQQMLLSLLAARELLAALTLVLPTDRQPLARTWQTAMGPVELRITMDTEAETPCLRVQTQLPCGGRVQLTGEAGQTTAQRSLAGPLTVVLQAVGFDQPYTLTLELTDGSAATPPSALTFTLRADQPLS